MVGNIQLLFDGPYPQRSEARRRVLSLIVDGLHRYYGEQVLAIALYGSMAKGTDEPYSDIELFCVLEGNEFKTTHEWLYGRGKAEVNVYSLDLLREIAVTVDEHWSLRQGNLLHISPCFGEPAFFDELKRLAQSVPDEAFDEVIRKIILTVFYEGIGKLRNLTGQRHRAYLAPLACDFAEHGALMLGLERVEKSP